MRSIHVIYCTTVVTLCSLYAAQPIQPVFQQEFNLTSLQAILFTTFMMAPLGFAPLFYGYLLEAYPARKLVRTAVLIMGLLEIWFASTSSYFMLLAIRAAQGLVIPAILTSLMSYISYTVSNREIQQSVAFYIASTIVGGFIGRALSGLFTDLFSWRFFFYVLGGMFLLCYFMLGCLQSKIKMEYVKPQLKQLFSVFRERHYFWLYCSIFCVFFTFSAMMNFLPFELKKIAPSSGESGTGFLYSGYIMGVLVSVSNRRIRSWFSHETNAVAVGIIIFAAGTAMFLFEQYWMMFTAMFVFCTGMFTAHSLLSGYLNTIGTDNKAVANGLYMSCYYTGGTLGSFLPNYILVAYDWSVFIYFLLFVLTISFISNIRLRLSV